MILIMAAIFGGISIGFMLGYIFANMFRKIKEYSGTMKIIREDNRLLYSLELNEDPAMLEGKREIVFKVESSDESSSRK